jgi:hypothetical protein
MRRKCYYKRKYLISRQSKNISEKNESYSASHLLAVKTKDPEKGKQNNLKAVQKKHSKDPEKWQQDNYVAVQKYRQNVKFPPSPPSLQLQHKMINDFCLETSPNLFIESGCTVCGKLTPSHKLQKVADLALDLDILKNPEVT